MTRVWKGLREWLGIAISFILVTGYLVLAIFYPDLHYEILTWRFADLVATSTAYGLGRWVNIFIFGVVEMLIICCIVGTILDNRPRRDKPRKRK